ncbi:hypothetical protein KZX50_00490 [Bacillus infantis]|uniref:hypothetical protein n=1 Tax=Bacillus infantis TaxID=324767 RepID=UPI002002EA41|nr:hypothetical protein [Bacillus infantis]MCK6203925.1 hypothetical protein [Bacillus infantis]
MALNSKTVAEIQRKAQNGIALVSTTPEKQKLYDQYAKAVKPAAPRTPASNTQSKINQVVNAYTQKNNTYKPQVYNPVKTAVQNSVSRQPAVSPASQNANQFDRNPANPYSLKTGVFTDQKQAQNVLNKFTKDYGASNGRLIQDQGGWRVFGDYNDLTRANNVGNRVQQLGLTGVSHVVQNTGNVKRQDLSYNKYQPGDPRYLQDLPKGSADALAGFNGKNLNEFSGMYAVQGDGTDKTYQPMTHSQAMAVNPLHAVNGNRQSLIKDAVSKGDWTNYWNFEAAQTPMLFNKDANGNAVQNKDYYKPYIESTIRAINEAQMSGDAQGAEAWSRRLNEWVDDFKKAPDSEGGVPYIIGLNSSADYMREFGLGEEFAPSANWGESKYNNPNVWQKGMEEERLWYDNPYMRENPEYIDMAINAANKHLQGPALEAAQAVNNPYVEALKSSAPGAGSGASSPSAGGAGQSGSTQSQYALNYEDAASRMQQQLDPLYQRAVENVKSQQYQNELNASQAASSRGLSHSGLAADQMTKLAIASQGQIADLDAQRSAKVAEMAQALLEREQERAFRDKQFEYQKYIDDRNFDYQSGRDNVMDDRWKTEFDYSKLVSDRNFDYQAYRDSIADQLAKQNFEYQKSRDQVGDKRYEQEFEYQKQRDAIEDAWRKYTFNNMSESEKTQLEWAKQQYGEDKAWQMYELQYNGELTKSMSQAEIDFYNSQGFQTP